MKLKYILISLFFFALNISFAQDWITTEITDFTAIEFPKPTDYNESQSESIISTFTGDAIYSVSYRLLPDDQSSQIENGLLQNFYDGVVNGIIDASKAKLQSKANCTANGFNGIDITYLAPPHPKIPSKRVKRIFYINKYVIHINYWQLTKDAGLAEKNKKRFFDSFTIKKTAAASKPTTASLQKNTEAIINIKNESSEGWFTLSGITSLLILLAIIIAIILLIRFFKK